MNFTLEDLMKKSPPREANLQKKDAVAPDTNWREMFEKINEQLPEKPVIPFHLTPVGARMAKFKNVCPEQFLAKIDRSRLPNPEAFDEVAQWNGTYPGPCAIGKTGKAKTLAAWSAIGRLYTYENKPFAWFPVRRLVTELAKYEEHNVADEFFRAYSTFPVLMVDDLDKINWDFQSQAETLFAFYDWIYREKRPCLTTTNKDRAWWANKLGDAFVRRLFDDAHFTVSF